MKAPRWAACLVALAVLAVGGSGVAAPGSPAGGAAPLQAAEAAGGSVASQARVTLDFREADVRDVLRMIAVQYGVSVVPDPDVSGRVTVHLTEVPLEQALRWVLLAAGLVYEKDGEVYRVRRAPAVEPLFLDVRDGRLTLKASGAALERVLGRLAEAAHLNLTLAPGVSGTVTAHLQEVPVMDALRILAEGQGLAVGQESGIWQVGPKLAEPKTRVGMAGAEGPPPDLLPSEAEPVVPGASAEPFVEVRAGLVSVRARNAEVRELIWRVARGAALPVVVDAGVEGRVSALLVDMPAREAIRLLAVQAGHVLVEAGPTLLVVGAPRAQWVSEQVQPPPPPARGAGEAAPEGIGLLALEDGVLSASLRDAPLGQVLDELTRRYGAAGVLPPMAVSGELTATRLTGSVAGVPLIDGLRSLLAPYGLDLVAEGNVYRVVTKPSPPAFEVAYRDGQVSLRAQGAPLASVVAEIGRQAGVPVLLEVTTSPAVTVYFRDLPLQAALSLLAEAAGLELVARDPGYRLVASGPLRTGASAAGAAQGEGAPARLPPGFRRLVLSESEVWAEFEDVPVPALLQELSGRMGVAFLAGPELGRERLSGRLQGPGGDQAADTLRRFLSERGYVVIAFAGGYLARGADAQEPFIYRDAGGRFTIDAVGADLVRLLRRLAALEGAGIIVYPQVRGTVHHVQLHGLTFEQALEALLRGTTFSYVRQGQTFVVGEGITPRSDSADLTTSRVVSLQHLSADQLIRLLPPSFPAANVRPVPDPGAVLVTGSPAFIAAFEAFVRSVDRPAPRVVADVVPIRYATAEEVVGALTKAFPPEAIQYLATANALLVTGPPALVDRIKGYMQVIDTPKTAAQPVILPLKHLKAQRAKQLLPPGVDTAKVLVDDQQNALIVTARQDVVERVRAFLQQVDVPNPQIVFDVVVFEISRRSASQLGVSARTSDDRLKFDPMSLSPFALTVGSGGGGATLLATLNALVQQGRARVLASPRIATLNGHEASFRIVTTSRFFRPRTSADNNGNSGGQLPADGGGDDRTGASSGTAVITDFLTVETGIKLRLLPWVSPSGEITLDVQPEFSDSAGTTGLSGLPQTNDRSVQTTVRVRDGETVVIGGLFQRLQHRDLVKVPVLGDLPILGRLFQATNATESETEFAIAITSHLVESLADVSRGVDESQGLPPAAGGEPTPAPAGGEQGGSAP